MSAGVQPPKPVAQLQGPHIEAMRAAHESGYRTGERHGYTTGWRFGLFCGGFVVGLGGCLGVLAGKALGWL